MRPTTADRPSIEAAPDLSPARIEPFARSKARIAPSHAARRAHAVPRVSCVVPCFNEADNLRQIAAQLDAFERAIGHAPHFVDDHRHVHQLPVVRDQLAGELSRRYPVRRPWLRRTVPRQALRGGVKPLVIAALGSHGLGTLARRHGLGQNRCLLGIYNFGDDDDAYLHRLTAWLHAAEDGDLLVCHPAIAAAVDDPIARARVLEHRVLASALFASAIAAANVDVVRLSAVP